MNMSDMIGKLHSLFCAFFIVFVISGSAPALQTGGSIFQTGDVLAGVGNGQIKHFHSDGALQHILNTGAGSTEDTGMAFDAAGNLYATVFEANNLYKFDNQGNLIGTFGSGFNRDPESIVFDKTGNAYVGQADVTGQILKFGPTGTLLASFSPQREDRGTDWIDLAADQCTMHYTSEGPSIKQFNVCSNSQMPDFATGLGGPCYGHRIRPNFEELVACTTQVYRLNSSGTVVQTYVLPGTSLLFALNLDPDNKTFWTADIFNGTVFRVDIASGAIVKQFNAGIFETLAGLTVVGEITAAITAPPFTTSWYVSSGKSSTLKSMGQQLASQQVAAGGAQDSVVSLLFKAPTFNPNTGVFGAVGPNAPTSLSTIATLVEAFASGYYNATGTNKTLHVRIVIATSNGTTQCGGNQVTFAHGKAWADMVNAVATWVMGQGYSGQVDIAGGSDMELANTTWDSKAKCGATGKPVWAGPADTRAWVDGYSSVQPRRFLYDVGDAGGCPTTPATSVPGKCNNGYTQQDLWQISWNAPPSEPLPEIYNSANATEWAQLSSFGFQHTFALFGKGTSVIMSGTLTEFQACVNNPKDSTCKSDFFSQAELQACAQQLSTCNPVVPIARGWQALFNSLNAPSSPHTAQTLPWSTDIKWGPN